MPDCQVSQTMNSIYRIGQRWISHPEPGLGLGIVSNISGRQVIISYPAVKEERAYAIEGAPLGRVTYQEGDQISTHDDTAFTVVSVLEQDGLVSYEAKRLDGDDHTTTILEAELSSFVRFSDPLQRLASGQLDKPEAYKLRVRTLELHAHLQQCPVRGLLGTRNSLLEHQIYIAHEVASRHAPRVLLADEVGLGKTIEAGMIVHQQLLTGLAGRVLILVPEALVHQWLVEMIRRFNLVFATLDEQRCRDLAGLEVAGQEAVFDDVAQGDTNPANKPNPFECEQLIICSIDWLVHDQTFAAQAMSAEWDLVVVDEAHHLQWSDQGQNQFYSFTEHLAQRCRGLLLLTATPEQLGHESHFARLRLLDPHRYQSLQQFEKDEQAYAKLNQLLEAIVAADAGSLNPVLLEEIATFLPNEDLSAYQGELSSAQREQLWQRLLDLHGTGRVLFRNTRDSVKGFGRRQLIAYPLVLPKPYQVLKGQDALFPETSIWDDSWVEFDPRVDWLVRFIKEHPDRKILVIASRANTAVKLEMDISVYHGIRCAAFHEGLNIVERDRAAAWFADEEDGAQALICSEIGSEGRNFQFASDLVMFDLPLNPDLLEQRIGRLDRIGQKSDVCIHVPYFDGSAQLSLLRWFDEGLNAFNGPNPAASRLYELFNARLAAVYESPISDMSELEKLIADTQAQSASLIKELQSGRNKLLEYNSCRKDIAQSLLKDIESYQAPQQLHDYLTDLFDELNIHHEYHSENALVIRQRSSSKLTLPPIYAEPFTGTFDRTKALAREDMEFLTWEHPVVADLMDQVVFQHFGSNSMSLIQVKGIPAGTILVEAYFSVLPQAPAKLQLNRFMPSLPRRVMLDQKGRDISDAISHEGLNSLCKPLPRNIANELIKQERQHIKQMLASCQQDLEQYQKDSVEAASSAISAQLGSELTRLRTLQSINANVRDDEIRALQEQLDEGLFYIAKAGLKMEAIRVVVNAT